MSDSSSVSESEGGQQQQWAVGTRLRLQTVSSDSVIEGEVFAHDTVNGVLVLQVWPSPSSSSATTTAHTSSPSPSTTTHTSSASSTTSTTPHDLNPITQNKKSYRILNVAQLRNVHNTTSTTTTSTSTQQQPPSTTTSTHTLRPVRPIDVQRISAKEAQALAEAQREVERIGIGVGSAAQRIFNALSKTLPCKWDKDTIVVFDDLRIHPPYRVEDVRGGPKTIDRELNRVKQVLEGETRRLGL